MNKTFETLENLLKKDERFVSQDGKVMRNAVYEASNKMDEKLLSLLMSDKKIKEIFFKKVNDIYVYDKNKFNFVINNRQMLPNSYTRYKQDIGLINSKDDYISATNDVVLSFPFKDCVLEFDSTDPNQKREELFYNEILAHDEIDHLFSNKVLTNAKLIDKDGEKEITEFDEDSNLLIKGNNLLAMHSLLPRYKGKVKLMYWDILYNTDSDEVPYADSFKHSSWLVMMKNRIDVAKKLLSDEGIMFIHLDATELGYLNVLMDEIFDRENRLGIITCGVKAPSGVASGAQMIFDCSEYILIYANNIFKTKYNHIQEETEIVDERSKSAKFYKYLLNKVDMNKCELVKDLGEEKIYRIKKENFEIKQLENYSRKEYYDNFNKIFRTAALSGGREKVIKKIVEQQKDALESLFVFEHTPTRGKRAGEVCRDLIYKNGGVLMLSDYCRVDDENKQVIKTQHITSIFSNDWWQGIANEGEVTLKNGKKPEMLLKKIIEMGTNKEDLVLDAYFGTGTTGAVAMKMRRRFIGIEQLDSHVELAKTRLKNVIDGDETGISKSVDWKGGGSFVYCELRKLNENYIESIKQANTKKELNIIWNKMGKTGFISCFANKNKIDEILQDIDNSELDLDSFKKLLIEILDKNQLYVNYEDMNDIDFKVSEKDKKFTESFYNVK